MTGKGREHAAGQLDILNCAASGRVEFTYRCPMTWEEMAPTDDDRKRHCERCDRAVFRCHDANEAGLRADQGECIAVPAWLADGARESRGPTTLVIGRSSRRELFAEIVETRTRDRKGEGDGQ